MSVGKSREKLHGKSKANLWRNLSTDTLPNFFSTILCFVALLKCIFFFRKAVLGKLFDIWFSYKHCNFSHVCLLVKDRDKIYTKARRFFWRNFMSIYGCFLSIIAVIVTFLLGFHEFAVMPVQCFLGVMYRQLPNSQTLKFESTLPLDT